MKSKKANILVAGVLCIAFFCAPAIANAETLTIYTQEKFEGNSLISSTCNLDVVDNVYDSGAFESQIKGHKWTSVWNNTVLFGDERIAKIWNGTSIGSFNYKNTADHFTCNGGD